jgi:hypothetical protein
METIQRENGSAASGGSSSRGLERFLESHPPCHSGLLVYAGSEIVRLGERIVAVPWTAMA